MSMATTLDSLHSTLKLLSEPLRLRLCALLGRSDLAVQEVVSISGLQQSRVSNHLSLLKRAGVVRDRREGNWSFHSLVEPSDDGPLSPSLFTATVEPYLDSDEGARDLAAFQVVLDRRRAKSREAHDRLAGQWQELGEEFAIGTLRSELLAQAWPCGPRLRVCVAGPPPARAAASPWRVCVDPCREGQPPAAACRGTQGCARGRLA